MAFEEDVGSDHVGLFENLASQPGTRFEQRRSDLAADRVAAHIAQHAAMVSTMQTNARLYGITSACQQPDGKQQRVARQDCEEPTQRRSRTPRPRARTARRI